MGSSSSALELSAKFEKAATLLPQATQQGVLAAAQAGKEVWLGAAASAGLHIGRKMHGVGAFGAAWGVNYKVVGDQYTPELLLRFRGPVHLVESDTVEHQIGPGKFSQALRFDSGDVRNVTFMHPGTTGKHFFPSAKQAVVRQTPPIIAAGNRRALVFAGFG